MTLNELIVARENQNLCWQNNVDDTSYANENWSKGKNMRIGQNEEMRIGLKEGMRISTMEGMKIGETENIQRRRRRIPILH
jgi:hypothetical protein